MSNKEMTLKEFEEFGRVICPETMKKVDEEKRKMLVKLICEDKNISEKTKEIIKEMYRGD